MKVYDTQRREYCKKIGARVEQKLHNMKYGRIEVFIQHGKLQLIRKEETEKDDG